MTILPREEARSSPERRRRAERFIAEEDGGAALPAVPCKQ
jgi:hypothetical protein